MRNFSHSFPSANVVFIDFTRKMEDLEQVFSRLTDRLVYEGFEKSVGSGYTPSEEAVLADFLSWFQTFRVRGQAISASYPRMSMKCDLPSNTVFTYVNCNTGVGLVFIGEFNDGYGDVTYAGDHENGWSYKTVR